VLKAERDRAAAERKQLETEREILTDERTVFEAEKEEFEEEQGGRMGGRVSGSAVPGREENPDAISTKILAAPAAEEPGDPELDEDLLRAIEDEEPAVEAVPAAVDEDPSVEEAEPMEIQPIEPAPPGNRRPRPCALRERGWRRAGPAGGSRARFPGVPGAPEGSAAVAETETPDRGDRPPGHGSGRRRSGRRGRRTWRGRAAAGSENAAQGTSAHRPTVIKHREGSSRLSFPAGSLIRHDPSDRTHTP